MKINILLPCVSRYAIGGFKVMLEYANRMAIDGHDVTIYYPIEAKVNTVNNLSYLRRIRMYRKVITKKLKQTYSASVWFSLNKGVKEKLVPNLSESFIHPAHITIATSWETAEWLATYSTDKGDRFYLIQGYEDWSGTKKEVDNTWKLPFKKIVIANWLKDYAATLGEQAILVNSGLDFDRFYIKVPIDQRVPHSIIMPCHPSEIKGSSDGIKAISLVKEVIPELNVQVFSIYDKPDFVPDWITFHRNPSDLMHLYNSAAIFISPSWNEGWGLPRAEAMQCGCATIITDIPGHKDYGTHGKDLILTPVKDPKAMAANIIALIRNNEQRIAIASSGNTTIQQFTWEAAYQKLKAVLALNRK